MQDSLDDVINVLNTKENGRKPSLANLERLQMSTELGLDEIGKILNDKENKNYRELSLVDQIDKHPNNESLGPQAHNASDIRSQAPGLNNIGRALEDKEEAKIATVSRFGDVQENLTLHSKLSQY